MNTNNQFFKTTRHFHWLLSDYGESFLWADMLQRWVSLDGHHYVTDDYGTLLEVL